CSSDLPRRRGREPDHAFANPAHALVRVDPHQGRPVVPEDDLRELVGKRDADRRLDRALDRNDQTDRLDRGDLHRPVSLRLRSVIARRTRSGVMGSSVMRTPTASAMALPMEGATDGSPTSPTPLAPNGPSRCGVSTRIDSNWPGISMKVGTP